MVTRYVNTASSAGGDGTTNGTSGATRAYATVAAWESARQADLTSTDAEEALCCGTAASGVVTIDGWTTTATNYVRIAGNPNDATGRHQGKYSTSYFRIEGSEFYGAIRNQEAHVRIEGIQVRNTSTTAGEQKDGIHHRTIPAGVSAYLFHDRVIIYNCAGDGISADQTGSTGQTIVIRNCVIQDCSLYGINIYNENSETDEIDNNTVVDCGTRGISLVLYGTTDTLRLRNNLVFNCVDDYYLESTATTSTITHNAYSQGTDPGTSGTSLIGTAGTAIFADYTGDDFHLLSGSPVIDLGTDLSASFTTDIDGATRSGTWDIGADEYSAVFVSIDNLRGIGRGVSRGVMRRTA